MRRLACLFLLASCGERIEDDTRWRVAEPPELVDVTFLDASGAGEDVWAVGDLDGATVIAHYDHADWSLFEPVLETGAVAISLAGSRVWIIDELGHLARRAGEQWTDVDLSDTLAVAPEEYTVLDVWGSGPEDVYAIAEVAGETLLVHFDGDGWVVDQTWRDLLTIGPEESAWLRHGCGGGADVWMSVERLDDSMGYSAEVLHGNGVTWTRDELEIFAPRDSFITQLACDASVVYAAGTVTGVVHVARNGSPWTDVVVADASDPVALAAGENEAWLAAGAEIWRLTEDLAEPTLDEDLGVAGPFTAAWATAKGRAFVFGVDGIILERAP